MGGREEGLSPGRGPYPPLSPSLGRPPCLTNHSKQKISPLSKNRFMSLNIFEIIFLSSQYLKKINNGINKAYLGDFRIVCLKTPKNCEIIISCTRLKQFIITEKKNSKSHDRSNLCRGRVGRNNLRKIKQFRRWLFLIYQLMGRPCLILFNAAGCT